VFIGESVQISDPYFATEVPYSWNETKSHVSSWKKR